MDTSFSSSTLKSTMKKYPTNDNNDNSNNNDSGATIIEPNSTWTIEQLLHWSLDQYHNVAMNRTAAHIDALRTQCENECEDIMTLHEVAVSMKGRGELMDEEGEGGRAAEAEQQQRVARGENANPQQKKMKNDKQMTMTTSASITSSGGDVTTNSTLTHQTTNIQQQQSSTSSSNIKLKSSTTTSTTTTTPTTLQITITSGPHTHQTYNLIPKPSQPCLIGRSKGKKFIKNGISLNKDQEVSTTHGKISVEHVYLDGTDDGNGGGNGSGGMQTKFYYTDVGSTNGTTLALAAGEEGGSDNNLRLEPNVRMEIPISQEGGGGEGGGEGVELRLGNSTLKIVVVG